ncbi:ABC transporter ATP-binding protein [Rhodobacteraceae bacterium DSL-40]|uniref:ABC transporter ATP-binding protein n=1 Tax=Amaricoccus sp. B4 TaxID=3368557 RepID=UPI000DADB302
MSVLLDLDGITKTYPGVKANDDVSFSIEIGEIHALLGENGAGKSTLVKMIYGLARPDAGAMHLGGVAYAPHGPVAARAAGVAMVFQHFSLFEALTVAENIELGMENAPPRRELAQRIREVSAEYGLPLEPDRLIGDLSVGIRQRVEIVRCLLQSPRLLIMDEPTSVLTPQEVEQLFATLTKLRAEGVSILYISHKLDEIRQLCDRATILRGGKVVATCIPAQETARSMAGMMIGQELAQPSVRDFSPGEVLLELEGLSLPAAGQFGVALHGIGFRLRAGEILGIGGVAGNGQDEFLLALSGERRVEPRMIRLAGRPIGGRGPEVRRGAGLLTAPEERLGHAAAPAMTLAENALLTGRRRAGLTQGGFLRSGAIGAFARRIIADFDVRTPGIETLARALSGGNLQKFVIGREVLQAPSVLVVNQPTWGVDAHAAAQIRGALQALADGGAGVIVISQDLDELMEISDTFAVLANGRMSPVRPATGLDIETIGRMMGGAFGAADAEFSHASA